MAIKKKMKKKPARTVGLNSDRSHDVESIENLVALQKVLPGCSDITAALRYLCETVAPKEREKFLKLAV